MGDLQGKGLGGQLGFRYPQLDGIGVKLIREKDYASNIRKISRADRRESMYDGPASLAGLTFGGIWGRCSGTTSRPA